MASVLAFRRVPSPTPAQLGAQPDYLQQTCARIERATRSITPPELRRRLERFDGDQLNVVQIAIAAFIRAGDEFSRPQMILYLLNVVVGSVERGVRP